MTLDQIYTLAVRYVPIVAAEPLLYGYPAAWRPAHEIAHFLIATKAECRQPFFGLDIEAYAETSLYTYAVVRELAAMSISQKLLRRAGYAGLANDEIMYTDDETLGCSHIPRFQRSIRSLLKRHVPRVPKTKAGLEKLLARKAGAVKTAVFPTRRSAERAADKPLVIL